MDCFLSHSRPLDPSPLSYNIYFPFFIFPIKDLDHNKSHLMDNGDGDSEDGEEVN